MFEKPFLSSEWDGFFTFPMILCLRINSLNCITIQNQLTFYYSLNEI